MSANNLEQLLKYLRISRSSISKYDEERYDDLINELDTCLSLKTKRHIEVVIPEMLKANKDILKKYNIDYSKYL